MASIIISGKEYKYTKATLAKRQEVGFYILAQQENSTKFKEQSEDYRIAIETELKIAVAENRIPKLPKPIKKHILPFKLRFQLSERKAWREFLDIAIQKKWFWKIFRISPRQLWFSVISVNDAEELKAGFFGLWEEILKKQNEQSRPLGDSKQSSTE